jgi:hypothetical protein
MEFRLDERVPRTRNSTMAAIFAPRSVRAFARTRRSVHGDQLRGAAA